MDSAEQQPWYVDELFRLYFDDDYDFDEDLLHLRQRNFWLRQVEELKYQMKQHSTGNVNKISNSRPKIQKIPQQMAERVDFREYYEPQIISIGPIHLAKADLLRGKIYKDIWAAMYLDHTNSFEIFKLIRWKLNSNLDEFFQMGKVTFGNEDVRRAYNYDLEYCSKNYYPDYESYEMKTLRFAILALVLDGCSVLGLLEKSDNSVDPEKELQISMDKLVRVHQDLLIMDNQIPFQFLRLLCEDEARLERCLHNFLQVHGIQTALKLRREKKVNDAVNITLEEDDEYEPLHLLDYLRRALLMRDQATFYKDIKIKRRSLHLRKYRVGTIRELKAAGIQVRKYGAVNSFFPNFIDGVLELPELTVDGSTAHIFLNLVAYEMCPDFNNSFEISSFIVFMSSLIDQPEDVKELRMAGIIINDLANDKQVADLFNKMDTFLVPETPLFANIRDQIQLHFESKRGKIKILSWTGEAFNTFFRSPWTIIALLAATLGLVLTFIQTWFAIHPKCS